MDPKKTELIERLIACNCTRFAEADREWMGKLEMAQLEAMQAPEGVGVLPEVPPPAEPVKPKVEPEVVAPEVPKPAATPEEFIATAPKELQAVLNDALAAHRAHKAEIVKLIAANEDNRFTAEELGAMDSPVLEKLASLAKVPVVNRALQGGGPAAGGERHAPRPKDVFEVGSAYK